MSEVKRRNLQLKAAKARGSRLEEGWHQAKFRSRKAPRQGCCIPASAVTEFGAYYTLPGKLRMSERLPAGHGDSRLTRHNGQYHLVVTCPAQRCVSETQARVVALDPGIRSFLTWLSETDAGHIAPGAFGKIQRLCAHLDALLSRAKLERRRWAKRNKYLAADRMRVRIGSTWWTSFTTKPPGGWWTISTSSCCPPSRLRRWPGAVRESCAPSRCARC